MRSTIRRLIIAATLVNGLLASGSINRNVVDMPAWREVGPLGWAAFSRRADLGWRAMIVYPSEAFAGMILSVAAAALFWRDRTAPRAAAVPMYAAALLTISGLLFTINAAQIMLSVRHLGDDPIALRRAFDGFEFWGWWRGVCQCSAYLASFWAHIERRHGRETSNWSVSSMVWIHAGVSCGKTRRPAPEASWKMHRASRRRVGEAEWLAENLVNAGRQQHR